MTRKAKILARVKSYLRMNDLTAERWWRTPNHALNSLTPHQFSQNKGGYNKLEELVAFSETRLDDFCTKDTGPCTKCDIKNIATSTAWDRILRRKSKNKTDTVATKNNIGTVATSTNDGTEAT